MAKICSAIVIDDEKDVVTTFSDYLEIIGIDVVGKGYDGKDAITLYESNKPDVVFLDLMMPNFDGFYAYERIKVLNPQALIVIVTADARDNTTKLLEDLKPTFVLYKPYDLKIVQKTIKTITQINSMNNS